MAYDPSLNAGSGSYLDPTSNGVNDFGFFSDIARWFYKSDYAKDQEASSQAYQREAYQNELDRQFNSAEAQKERDWQTQMSNTAHQREMADLQAAGLNPILAASGTGASATNGASATATSHSAAATPRTKGNMAGLFGSLLRSTTSALTSAYKTASSNVQSLAKNASNERIGALNNARALSMSSNDGSDTALALTMAALKTMLM